jgi:hypothetical protein
VQCAQGDLRLSRHCCQVLLIGGVLYSLGAAVAVSGLPVLQAKHHQTVCDAAAGMQAAE